MKKIVIFLNGYLPARKYGGPVTSIVNLVESLGDKYSFYIVSNDHDLKETKRLENIHSGWNQVGKAKVLYLNEKEFTKKRFIAILKEIDAQAVYMSSIFSYRMSFAAIKAAKSLKIPAILAPRGELCKNALSMGVLKKKLFIVYIKFIGIFKNVSFQVTSEEEEEATARFFGKYAKNIYLLPNMPYNGNANAEIKKEVGCLRIVFLSRILKNKNLLFALQQVVQSKANILFDIYGPIESNEYWEECQSVITWAPANIKIEYKGQIEPGTSGEIFKNYDCFLFPTMGENYGHVIVEALTSGCVPIISRGTTPWDDMDRQGGFALGLNEPEKWLTVLEELATMDCFAWEKLQEMLVLYGKDKLQIEQVKAGYVAMFDSIN